MARRRNLHKSGPRRIVRRTAGCGDASACLKLRTPLIRRDPHRHHFKVACPPGILEKHRKTSRQIRSRPAIGDALTSLGTVFWIAPRRTAVETGHFTVDPASGRPLTVGTLRHWFHCNDDGGFDESQAGSIHPCRAAPGCRRDRGAYAQGSFFTSLVGHRRRLLRRRHPRRQRQDQEQRHRRRGQQPSAAATAASRSRRWPAAPTP